MDVCRTCLGVESLSPIFNDEDLIRKSNELFEVTGIKVKFNAVIQKMITLISLLA